MPSIEDYAETGIHIMKNSPEWAQTYFENVKDNEAEEEDMRQVAVSLGKAIRVAAGALTE